MATLQAPRPPATSSRPLGLIRHALGLPLANLYLVLVSAGLLVGLGLLMVLSASSVYAQVNAGDPYYFVKRQLIFFIVGLAGSWVLLKVRPTALRFLGWAMLLGSIVMLALTMTPLGVTVGGNRNWVQFGTSWLRFQPSEFAKVAIILWGADHLARKEKVLDRWKELSSFLLVTGIILGLVVLQKDLGSAMVLAILVAGMLFAIGAPLRILGLMASVAALGVAGLVIASPNRMRRVLGFLDPMSDPEGVNQQPIRALYGLATGGWTGVGLGNGKQKWGMLVGAHTDYIFAVIGEELGLIGSVGVIALFGVLIVTAFRIARASDDAFHRNLAMGVGVWFAIQTLVNIGVVLRLLPVIGVTLPLISYGGSSLLMSMAAVALLCRAARNEPRARRTLEKARRSSGPRVTSVVDGPRAAGGTK